MRKKVRLSREEAQTQTRNRLLDAAQTLFLRDGYVAASVERIAETAGYSKGAFYSNFESKEAIFVEVIARQGRDALEKLSDSIVCAADAQTVVELLAEWADSVSTSGSWALTILEHARVAPRGSGTLLRQSAILRRNWNALGEALLRRFPGINAAAETLGALLHEIAYAPAISIMGTPTAGDLVRLTMKAILAGEVAISIPRDRRGRNANKPE